MRKATAVERPTGQGRFLWAPTRAWNLPESNLRSTPSPGVVLSPRAQKWAPVISISQIEFPRIDPFVPRGPVPRNQEYNRYGRLRRQPPGALPETQDTRTQAHSDTAHCNPTRTKERSELTRGPAKIDGRQQKNHYNYTLGYPIYRNGAHSRVPTLGGHAKKHPRRSQLLANRHS